MKQFDIAIFKLSNATHRYTFAFDDAFFQRYKEGFIRQGKGEVVLDLVKSSSMMELNFQITGTVKLTCDRSLDTFDYPLDERRKIILKFGEENKEIDDEIEIIVRDTQIINVYKYIYDFIYLAIPLKKLHPRYEQEEEFESLVYTSEEEGGAETGNETDPRWEALKKLKKNKT